MKQKLLLHACCAPCSSAILEHLSKHFDITLYYYNPCITDDLEYHKRAGELIRFVNDLELSNINVVVEAPEYDKFYAMSKGLENEPEGGARCALCYEQRLNKAAQYSKEHGFKCFSTTLTISPYKDSAVINRIGTKAGHNYGVMYMPFDFGFLYTRSLELCRIYDLYEQNYCGCEYSKRQST